ncbi:MAG: transglycosylase SLT domain-containing protein [Pseudomarimonas sp.]
MHMLLRTSIPLLLGLAGCATAPGPNSTQASQEHDALYAEINTQSQRYEAAQEQLRHGDAALGEAERLSALAALRDAASRCAASTGCDGARFIHAYEALLQPPDSLQAEAGSAEGEGVSIDPTSVNAASPVVTAMPAAARTVSLLRGRDLREFITVNQPVKAALNEWLTWMRPALLDTWENYRFMRYRMWPEYEQAGLPEALLFGILAKESGGRVHAVSRAGASGPLQFMPATGRRFGLGRDGSGFDTRFDPQLATRANVAYLNERFAELNTDLAMSLAAYNGGEGRMARLHRSSGGKSYWSDTIQRQLPAETRDYVPMVLAAAWLFLHPEEYGLEFDRGEVNPGELLLKRPASLNELAICLGGSGTRNGWFRTLRNLNPQFDPSMLLPAGRVLLAPSALVTAYQQHCLSGPRADLALDIARARAAIPTQVASAMTGSSASGVRYVVREGDTLAGIARARRCGSPQSLARSNAIKAPRYLIRPGQSLSLQGCRG